MGSVLGLVERVLYFRERTALQAKTAVVFPTEPVTPINISLGYNLAYCLAKYILKDFYFFSQVFF